MFRPSPRSHERSRMPGLLSVKGPLAVVVLTGLLGLAAGCSASPPPTASPLATPTAAPTPAPTPAATPTAAPATLRPLRMGPLEAGRYRTNSFDPQLVFTLPDGWSEFFPDEDDEIYMGAPGAELAISRPAQVRDPETSARVDVPDDLLAWLLDHPHLNASEPTPIEISGIQSSYVEPDATREVRLFAFPLGDFRIGAGNRHRMYVVPLDGPDLSITITAPEGGDLAAALAAAGAVVESLEIVP